MSELHQPRIEIRASLQPPKFSVEVPGLAVERDRTAIGVEDLIRHHSLELDGVRPRFLGR